MLFSRKKKHTPDHSLKKASEFCYQKLQEIKRADRSIKTSSNSLTLIMNETKVNTNPNGGEHTISHWRGSNSSAALFSNRIRTESLKIRD
jgi:hypothetical protein